MGWEDALEEGLATHSSILAWRIPLDRGAWWAEVHTVAKSQTRLKRLSTQHTPEGFEERGEVVRLTRLYVWGIIS